MFRCQYRPTTVSQRKYLTCDSVGRMDEREKWKGERPCGKGATMVQYNYRRAAFGRDQCGTSRRVQPATSHKIISNRLLSIKSVGWSCWSRLVGHCVLQAKASLTLRNGSSGHQSVAFKSLSFEKGVVKTKSTSRDMSTAALLQVKSHSARQ
jgi:hypothetical protein